MAFKLRIFFFQIIFKINNLLFNCFLKKTKNKKTQQNNNNNNNMETKLSRQ